MLFLENYVAVEYLIRHIHAALLHNPNCIIAVHLPTTYKYQYISQNLDK